MECKFGVILDVGYFSFTLKTAGVSSEACDEAYAVAISDAPIYGQLMMPASPVHKPAWMRINPAKVVGVVERPS